MFAVRVRGFTRNYRNAELDMHFSLKEDLSPLKQFLQCGQSAAPHGLVAAIYTFR